MQVILSYEVTNHIDYKLTVIYYCLVTAAELLGTKSDSQESALSAGHIGPQSLLQHSPFAAKQRVICVT